jgi:O-acetyl-ADP-ribose deacetylase (regulator of RNase III)
MLITVAIGDLAREPVDAVLRPAGAALEPVGADALRLDEIGGPRFADQRRTATPLESGAAVVTGGGGLAAAYVLHVVVADERGPASREKIRRALVSAWQRADDWGLARLAAPLVGAAGGPLTDEEAAALLVETFPRDGSTRELRLIVDAAARPAVSAIVGRTQG